jgi:hypothetical protein
VLLKLKEFWDDVKNAHHYSLGQGLCITQNFSVKSKDSAHPLSSIIILPFREIQTKSHRIIVQDRRVPREKLNFELTLSRGKKENGIQVTSLRFYF